MSLFRSSVGSTKVTSTSAPASSLRPHLLCACSLLHSSKATLCNNCSLCPAAFRHTGMTTPSLQGMCRHRTCSHFKATPMMYMAFTVYASGRDPSRAKTLFLGVVVCKTSTSTHSRDMLNSRPSVRAKAFSMFASNNAIKATMNGNPKIPAPKHICRVARVYTVATPNRPSSASCINFLIGFFHILVTRALSNPIFPPLPLVLAWEILFTGPIGGRCSIGGEAAAGGLRFLELRV